MKLKKNLYRACRRFSALLLITVAALPLRAQMANKIKPLIFYIDSMIDARAESKEILATQTQNSADNFALHNKFGNLVGYIEQRVEKGGSRNPIILTIKKLGVTEEPLKDGRLAGKLELNFSFQLKTGEGMYAHLVDYKSLGHYICPAGETNRAEITLEKAVDNALQFFCHWMVKQNDINPLLARRVQLSFTDYHDDTDADTVYYDTRRPLTWADFHDHPRYGKYAAEVVPGLGYTEKTTIDSGVIKVELAMKVFLPKSAAWVREGYADEYTLNHEQRHFDIVKIISERFKKRMLLENLPVLNYDGYVNVAYFDALRELDAMQKKYDNETGHGTNAGEQIRWNKFIDTELANAKSYAAN